MKFFNKIIKAISRIGKRNHPSNDEQSRVTEESQTETLDETIPSLTIKGIQYPVCSFIFEETSCDANEGKHGIRIA